jgi:hypothetical protein
MKSNIISERSRVMRIEYGLHYDKRFLLGAGYAFPCNAQGKIDTEKLSLCLLQSLNYCQQHGAEFDPPYVQTYVKYSTEPAVARCNCGEPVCLEDFTNTCIVCGRDYNIQGDSLASRSQWGEETGETAAQLLAVGYGIS